MQISFLSMMKENVERDFGRTEHDPGREQRRGRKEKSKAASGHF
jgi:hypothetical protein